MIREVRSEGRGGVQVLSGIACVANAKLMTSGFLKQGNTKDDVRLVGMIGKALEILDNNSFTVWDVGPPLATSLALLPSPCRRVIDKCEVFE